MAIEDIVVDFHGGTAASVSGKTINSFQGLGSTGEFDSDLSGYDTGGSTGVAGASAKTLTANTNGRFAGADTLTQEVNRQMSFVDDSVAPSDNTFTFTVPSTVDTVDVEVFLCTGFGDQVDLDVDVNGSTSLGFDSTNNTTGATVTLSSIAPNGSDQIVILIENNHPTNDFTAYNGIRLFNFVEGGATIDAPTGSITLTGQAPTIDTTNNIPVDVPVGSIALTGQVPIIQTDGSTTIEIPVGNITLTGQVPTLDLTGALVVNVPTGNISLTGQVPVISGPVGWVNDTFDGTGALGAHWSVYDDSAGGVINVGRDTDYFEGRVDDNSSNRTRWFDTEQGRLDYQTVVVPSSGVDEYILAGVGVGPVGDRLADLPFLPNQFSFCGLIVHDNVLTDQDYMFAVIGHRGSSDSSTIEIKGTTAGVSDVTDEGGDVLGTGVTHGDLRVEIDSGGVAKFSYRSLGTTPWTYINVGNTGLVPSSFSLGSPGTEFKLGIIGYASDTIGVPFLFTADSFTQTDFNTIEVPTGSISLTGNAPTISVTNNVVASCPPGAIVLTGGVPTVLTGVTTLTTDDINNIVQAIFAHIVEDSESFAQQMRLVRAEAAGKLLVSGTTVTIRDALDSKDRITATVDTDGQRTTILTDAD